MSDTDPYAGPTIEEARTPKVNETVAEKAPEADPDPEIETPVVPDGSVTTVLDWVDGDKDRAQAALEYEQANKKRSTLISELKEIIG